MSSTPDIDLWPKAKFETDLVTPVAILRKQAALLGEKTQQLVTADVTTNADSNNLTHYFRLVAPALDNYKYQLFYVSHKVDRLYPLNAHFQSAVRALKDQETFVEWLRAVLSSDATLQRIDSLMAQAKG